MKPYIFDGKKYAKGKEELLREEVRPLLKKGIIPKLVSIIVGTDPASVLYVNLKKKAAVRVGCELLVKSYGKEISKEEIINNIKKINEDDSVNGIMLQLPLPESFSKEDRDEILNSISSKKDVDGLSRDTNFITPTAKAVLQVLSKAFVEVGPLQNLKKRPDHLMKVVVVGALGFEGSKIVKALKAEYKNKSFKGTKFEISEADSKTIDLKSTTLDSDILISVTGVPDLITADMVKQGALLIDVGSPKGDVEKVAYQKASFVSPVPGGVGPMTISCLLQNLVLSANTA